MSCGPVLDPVLELEGMKHRAWSESKANCACVSTKGWLLTLLIKHNVLSSCLITPVFHQNEETHQGVSYTFRECRWTYMYCADSCAGGEGYCLPVKWVGLTDLKVKWFKSRWLLFCPVLNWCRQCSHKWFCWQSWRKLAQRMVMHFYQLSWVWKRASAWNEL